MEELSTWLAAMVAIVGAAAGAAYLRPSWASAAAASAALAGAVMLSLAWWANAAAIDWSLVAALGSRARIALDPLAAPLAVFACAIASPILYWAGGYLPHFLGDRADGRDTARFYTLMLGFMLAIVLLLLAQDLLLIFLALELTAGISYLLIRFDRRDAGARAAATAALLVTAGSSLAFLVGILLIAQQLGTLEVRALAAMPERIPPPAAALMVAGVLAKSAQAPLHFWLPRAMVAATPVSAYLHSAALVTAGVFVLLRIRPLLEGAPAVTGTLLYIGFASVIVGGVMALVSDELKRILAYSTIAQYGYPTVMVALGGHEALAGAVLFIVAHGLCKCALFLTAGAVSSASGRECLSELSGLARRAPVLAGASAVAAAGLAGLPLTVGYFKDELLLKAALSHGPLVATAAAAAVAVTLAYTGRFWLGLFLGPAAPVARPAARLVWPVALLAAFVVAGGVWTGPFTDAFAAAAATAGAGERPLELHYRLHGSAYLALAGLLGGIALGVANALHPQGLARVVGMLAPLAPSRWADAAGRWLARASDRLYELELRDLRDRFGAALVPTALLVAVALLFHSQWTASVGTLGWQDGPLAVALALTAFAALAATRARDHARLVVLLSFAGFALSLTLLLAGAPDVALVLVLIESVLTLVFLHALMQVRAAETSRGREEDPPRRGAWAGVVAGVAIFFPVWFALGSGQVERVGNAYFDWTETAHARDVVTAILADFRGLDTAGELTVFAVAVLGAAAVSWKRG